MLNMDAFDPFDSRLYSEKSEELITEDTDTTLTESSIPTEDALDIALNVMGELKEHATKGLGTSPGWTLKHTEAFLKYLNGFTYYCEQLKEDLKNYNKPV